MDEKLGTSGVFVNQLLCLAWQELAVVKRRWNQVAIKGYALDVSMSVEYLMTDDLKRSFFILYAAKFQKKNSFFGRQINTVLWQTNKHTNKNRRFNVLTWRQRGRVV